MTTEERSVAEYEHAPSSVALLSIRIHPAFGGGYLLRRAENLQLVPLSCPQSPQPKGLVRYDINGMLQTIFHLHVEEFKRKRYPAPYFTASYEGARSDERGEFDVFSVELDYNTSGWLTTHLYDMWKMDSIMIVSGKDLQTHLHTGQSYRITPPNYGFGHLTVDPRCEAVLLPEKPQFTQSKRSPLQPRMPRALRSQLREIPDYRLQPQDFEMLRTFVDPKIVDKLEKSIGKRRLLEKALTILLSLYEGLEVTQLKGPSTNRFNGLKFMLVLGLISTEAISEYAAELAQQNAEAHLGPIINDLAHKYWSDARLHGLTQQDLTEQLDSVAAALAQAEGIPSQFDETMIPTLGISGGLALSENYQLLSIVLTTSVLLYFYSLPLITANPFRQTGEALHLISKILSASSKYIPALFDSLGYNLPETAIIAMVAGHHLEHQADLSSIHAGRASLMVLRELLRMFDLSISAPALWKKHCKELAEKYSPDEIEAAVQKLQAEPQESVLFTDYSLGIEGNILLRNAELILRPGITVLELPQHAGLSRILGALSDNINHPRGIALQKNDDGSIVDLHTGEEHPIHFEQCGGIFINDPIPQFHPSMSEEQVYEYLQQTGLFSTGELDELRLGKWTTTNSFFRKRYALAAAGSYALYGSARVLVLDNFDMDVGAPSSWQSMIQFIQLVTGKGIPVLIGYHNDTDERSKIYDARLEHIQQQGIPLQRYTVKGQRFIEV